jgi:hypothetical protein
MMLREISHGIKKPKKDIDYFLMQRAAIRELHTMDTAISDVNGETGA